MGRGRASTSEDIIRKMFILHAEGLTPNVIGERLNKAPNTVRKHLADEANIEQYGDLMNKIEQIHKQSNLEIIDLIQSTKYSEIANNIVGLFNKENLQTEFSNNGIRSLISLLGNTVDKTMSLKRYELSKQELALKERTLALKEKELEARLDNPDAFSNIVIVDNTSEAAKYYKEHGIEKPYAEN